MVWRGWLCLVGCICCCFCGWDWWCWNWWGNFSWWRCCFCWVDRFCCCWWCGFFWLSGLVNLVDVEFCEYCGDEFYYECYDDWYLILYIFFCEFCLDVVRKLVDWWRSRVCVDSLWWWCVVGWWMWWVGLWWDRRWWCILLLFVFVCCWGFFVVLFVFWFDCCEYRIWLVGLLSECVLVDLFGLFYFFFMYWVLFLWVWLWWGFCWFWYWWWEGLSIWYFVCWMIVCWSWDYVVLLMYWCVFIWSFLFFVCSSLWYLWWSLLWGMLSFVLVGFWLSLLVCFFLYLDMWGGLEVWCGIFFLIGIGFVVIVVWLVICCDCVWGVWWVLLLFWDEFLWVLVGLWWWFVLLCILICGIFFWSVIWFFWCLLVCDRFDIGLVFCLVNRFCVEVLYVLFLVMLFGYEVWVWFVGLNGWWVYELEFFLFCCCGVGNMVLVVLWRVVLLLCGIRVEIEIELLRFFFF